MRNTLGRLLLVIPVLGSSPALSQRSLPDTLHAQLLQAKLHLDGRLDEPAWQTAPRVANFTQRELNEGQPATERTEVAILYDAQHLYIGAYCYDRQPEGLIAQKMKRDFDFDTEDNFEVVLDTYHDHRNGYLFVTNPNGARADALIIDNGARVNEDWDGVWDVAVSVTDAGWFAEIALPFSTLKFPAADLQVWGVNFERNIRRKREQVLWQGWSRDSELEQVSRAGTLIGLKGLGRVRLMELKPFASGGIEQPRFEPQRTRSKVGGDLNYLITPTLKLNVTVNTDFAQVESDREQVNLTRFSLFFPEKREFFLEGQNFFAFSMGRNLRPFYTRRIGISPERTEIPIVGGVRLLGKMGRTTLGVMSLQTAKEHAFPTTNYTVVRWKQDVLAQSSFGVIGIGKKAPGRWNATYGADFLYSTSSLFGDKNFTVSGAVVQSYTSDAGEKTGSAHRIRFSYPNDSVEINAAWERAGGSFNPEVGFLRRINYQQLASELVLKPRPRFLPWVRQMEFKLFDVNYFFADDTHDLTTFFSEFSPLNLRTKSGEAMEFNIQRRAEKLTEDFEIQDDVVVPPGEYWFTRYELQLETFDGRPLFGSFEVNLGDFYNGRRSEWSGRLGWRLSKHLSLSGDYTRNVVSLPAGRFVVDELGGRLEFALSPKLFGSLFGQWNNEDHEIRLNIRLNWIPLPGTDFFFVVNQSVDAAGSGWAVANTTVLSKFVWRFVL